MRLKPQTAAALLEWLHLLHSIVNPMFYYVVYVGVCNVNARILGPVTPASGSHPLISASEFICRSYAQP